MAAEVPRETDNPSAEAWLRISLTVVGRGRQLVFALTFCNADAQPRELSFSNLSRKAELAGLRIRQSGASVEPERTFIGRAARFTEPGRWLQPGEAWTYELVAERVNGILDFPGAVYRLDAGRQYQARFVYRRVASNEVTFAA